MLNLRNWVSRRGFVVLALAVAPSLVQAADSAKAPALDFNAKMQQKLNSKLGGQLDTPAASSSLDSKLSRRVDEKNAEVNQQLDEQAKTLTAADRGADDKEKQAEGEAQQ
jgi:hypothetical protein